MIKRLSALFAILCILSLFVTAHATVSVTDSRVQYTCNGITTTYAYPFKVLENSDILAVKNNSVTGVQTTLVLDTDYTVTGAGSVSGGNVVLTAGSTCGSGYTLTLLRNISMTQETDYVDGEAFSAESLEDAIDKQTLIIQQLQEQAERAPTLKPSTDITLPFTFPDPDPSKVIAWNATGTALESVDGATATTSTGVTTIKYLSNYADFATAVASIGSTSTTLIIDTGGTVSTDTTTPSTLHMVCAKQGGLNVATGKTLTINGSFEAGLYQVFGGSGSVSGLAYSRPEWWGVSGSDWGPAIQKAEESSSKIIMESSTYRVDTQVTVTNASREFVIGNNTEIILDNLAGGTPTANVHNTNNVLAAFKVSASNVRFIGGKISGLSSVGSNTTCGILLANGADRFSCKETEFSGLYTSIWPGGNISDFTVSQITIDGCTHNMYCGYHEGVAGGVQQITGATIDNITSKNSTNDGLKLGAFADQVRIIGGHFYDNTKDGIDTFISGQDVSIVGAHLTGNGINGLNSKYGSTYTGTGAGKGGYNRSVVISGCHAKGNTYHGFNVETDDPTYPPPNYILIGNIASENTLRGFTFQALTRSTIQGNIAIRNGQNGFRWISCSDLSIVGNVAEDNYTSGAGEGFIFSSAGGAFGANDRLTIMGNKAYGSATQTYGFLLNASYIQNSTVIGNESYNHTHNWSVSTGMTGMVVKDNAGFVTEYQGAAATVNGGGTISHGLAYTPTLVIATPSVAGEMVSVTAKGATTFTVAIKKHDGSAGTAQTIYWKAIYTP